MYGAIIGDIVGSKYKFNNIKSKVFPFVSEGCRFTDGTVMTVAVAKALLHSRNRETPFKTNLIQKMQFLGRKYPYAGYSRRFSCWLNAKEQQPYNSYGNGSAMRVSPCGLIAVELEEAITLARVSAEVTHNHSEGIKGAEATAAAVFLAKSERNKQKIGSYISQHYYNLSQTLGEIRPIYKPYTTCQNTVPQAIIAFLESQNFEDAIRNAISLGGDSNRLAAITGAIAWSYYRFNDHGKNIDKKTGRIWPEHCDEIITRYQIDAMIPGDFVETIDMLDEARMQRQGTYARLGDCSVIIPDSNGLNPAMFSHGGDNYF